MLFRSMGRAYLQWGKLSEAISAFEEAERLGGATPSVQAGRGQALALAGRTEEALQALARFEFLGQAGWIPAASFGIVKLGLGDYDGALDHFEQACDRRELAVAAFKVHPLYDPIRSHPRFQGLLRRANLLP